MKILILEANPDNDLSLNEEILELRKVIDQSSNSNQFQVEYGKAICREELQHLMLKFEEKAPQNDHIIVHFCGHGTGKQGLVFENEKGEKDLVSTQVLANFFELFRNSVACVVLNACYADVQAKAINEHIKYVIGMKQPIRDDAAIVFSIGFYRALAFQKSFEDAFKFGKVAIQLRIDHSSKSKNVIAEEISRTFVPVDEVPDTNITQEFLKPVLYQKKLPPLPALVPSEHFEDVLMAIQNGKIVPFLGSGINLCNRQKSIDPSNWESDGQYPPTRSELALYLEQKIVGQGRTLTGVQCPLCDPIRESLPNECPIKTEMSLTRLLFQYVSKRLELRQGVGGLQDALNQICRHEYTPNLLHEFLAELPRGLRQKGYENPILIVTANFDKTLELAFKKKKQPFDLISYIDRKKCFLHQKFRKDDRDQEKIVSKDEQLITQPNNYPDLDFEAYPVILKLYGPVDGSGYQEQKENFVITEDHFIDYLAQRPIEQMVPASILGKLKSDHIWFLGYGLSNWDERVPLRRIWDEKKHHRPWWAVQSNPTPLDISLWKENQVNLISVSLDNYMAKLHELLEVLPPKSRRGDRKSYKLDLIRDIARRPCR